MKLVNFIEFLRTRLKTVVRICFAVLAVVFLIGAIPGVINTEHAHTAIERFPGFWSIFGFIACVAIIIISKWFGHAGIMVRENYYDTDQQNADTSSAATKSHGGHH